MVGGKKFFLLLFSADALVWVGNDVFGETFIAWLFFLMIIGYPLSNQNFWVINYPTCRGFPIDVTNENAGFSKLNVASNSKNYENSLVRKKRLLTKRSLSMGLYDGYR